MGASRAPKQSRSASLPTVCSTHHHRSKIDFPRQPSTSRRQSHAVRVTRIAACYLILIRSDDAPSHRPTNCRCPQQAYQAPVVLLHRFRSYRQMPILIQSCVRLMHESVLCEPETRRARNKHHGSTSQTSAPLRSVQQQEPDPPSLSAPKAVDSVTFSSTSTQCLDAATNACKLPPNAGHE